ncbi:MAG TPA: EamA family transporter [Chthoniobacterales bacterium]|nr:EamA family transporter [Chthoniobacterales bacterium]
MGISATCVNSEDDKAQPESPAQKSPSAGSICLALIAVYLVWGSTYLGIRFAIESIPGFFMAGARFVSAGLIMIAVAWFRGARWPHIAVWRDALIVGGCLILGGNGAVTFAERYVPSGETALLVGCVPILMTLFAWFAGITRRPGGSIFFAMALGMAGVGVLARGGSSPSQASAAHHLLGVIVILTGCIIWSFGSLYARRAQRAESAILNIGLQMFVGGLLLFVASVFAGEPATLSLAAITQRSLLAWIYLVGIGAVIGYSAYAWLVRAASPSLVGTYAFVNPAVAVFLGWILGAEPISMTTIIGACGIVAAVAIIVLSLNSERQ